MALPPGPYGIVSDAYDTYKGLAEDTVEQSLDYIEQMAAYQLPEIPEFEVEFPDFETAVPEFEMPDAPIPPDVTVTLPSLPSEPSIQEPPGISTGGVPTLSASEPSLSFPGTPDELTATPPGDPEASSPITLPTLVDPTLPDTPTLLALTIPDAPALDIPTFDETIPEFELDFDVADFSYSEDIYNSALLDLLRSRISDMVNGGTGLPAPIETALFDRARTKEESTALSAQQTALEEWSSRGFTMPGGDISRRLAEVRENRRTAVNTINRDIMVRVHEAALDQLKAGVASGVQLEGSLMNYYAGYAERALRASIAIVEMGVASLNARIAFYNIQLARIDLAARVYETRVRAALAQVEIYKAQIDAEKTRGEINVQTVSLYQAQINAALSLVEIYKAKLEGARVQTEVERNKIETYKARIEGYSALVQAKRAEYDGYTAAVQAETAKVGIYEATVRAFGERVRAYQARVSAEVEANRGEVETEKLKIEQYDARIRAFTSQVQAEVGRIQAVTQIYDGQAKVFSAQASAEESRIKASAARLEIELEAGRSQTQLQLTKMTQQAQIAIQASAQALEAMKASAAVTAQLAAGAMTAVNTGASISGSDEYSIQYSGEL